MMVHLTRKISSHTTMMVHHSNMIGLLFVEIPERDGLYVNVGMRGGHALFCS